MDILQQYHEHLTTIGWVSCNNRMHILKQRIGYLTPYTPDKQLSHSWDAAAPWVGVMMAEQNSCRQRMNR